MCVLSCFCMAQFEAGTKSFGGGFTYASVKACADCDSESTMSLAPEVSYYAMDNVGLSFMLDYSKSGDADAVTSFGLGGTYHMGQMYGAASYMSMGTGIEDVGPLTFLNFRAGYLHPLSDNFYLDLFGSYTMGMGEVMEGVDNESTTMTFGAGFRTTF